MIHYPVPIPQQPALAAQYPRECPRATVACGEVLSLPLYPSIAPAAIDEVTTAICNFQEG